MRELITESRNRKALRIIVPVLGRSSATFICVAALTFFSMNAVHALTNETVGGIAFYVFLMTMFIHLTTVSVLPANHAGLFGKLKIDTPLQLLIAAGCTITCAMSWVLLPDSIPMASGIALTMAIFAFMVITNVLMVAFKVARSNRLHSEELTLHHDK